MSKRHLSNLVLIAILLSVLWMSEARPEAESEPGADADSKPVIIVSSAYRVSPPKHLRTMKERVVTKPDQVPGAPPSDSNNKLVSPMNGNASPGKTSPHSITKKELHSPLPYKSSVESATKQYVRRPVTPGSSFIDTMAPMATEQMKSSSTYPKKSMVSAAMLDNIAAQSEKLLSHSTLFQKLPSPKPKIQLLKHDSTTDFLAPQRTGDSMDQHITINIIEQTTTERPSTTKKPEVRQLEPYQPADTRVTSQSRSVSMSMSMSDSSDASSQVSETYVLPKSPRFLERPSYSSPPKRPQVSKEDMAEDPSRDDEDDSKSSKEWPSYKEITREDRAISPSDSPPLAGEEVPRPNDKFLEKGPKVP